MGERRKRRRITFPALKHSSKLLELSLLIHYSLTSFICAHLIRMTAFMGSYDSRGDFRDGNILVNVGKGPTDDDRKLGFHGQLGAIIQNVVLL